MSDLPNDRVDDLAFDEGRWAEAKRPALCGLHNQGSWAEYPRTRHSKKPDEIRRMIEEVSPVPRLELFAREPRAGWTSWGNELPVELRSNVDPRVQSEVA